MLWARAAASARRDRSRFGERCDVAGELLRADGEDGAAVHDLWHAGVGLHDDRETSRRSETADEGQHPVRPEAAVEARRVDAKPLEKRGDAFDVGARQELAVLAERNRRDDGKA